MPEWEQAVEELESATARLSSARPDDTGALNSGLRDRFYAASRIAELAHAEQSRGREVDETLRKRIERALDTGAAVEGRMRLMQAGLRAELIETERTRAVLLALALERDEVNPGLVDYSG